jgi:hypothetical protein
MDTDTDCVTTVRDSWLVESEVGEACGEVVALGVRTHGLLRRRPRVTTGQVLVAVGRRWVGPRSVSERR